MSLNESIVEDAALEWFILRNSYGGHVGSLGYKLGPTLPSPRLPTTDFPLDAELPRFAARMKSPHP